MELTIKIPEELYRAYKDNPPMLGDAGMDMIAQAIANGTPLDKIKSEIEGLTYYWCEVNPRSVINDVLQIIDKYKIKPEDIEAQATEFLAEARACAESEE